MTNKPIIALQAWQNTQLTFKVFLKCAKKKQKKPNKQETLVGKTLYEACYALKKMDNIKTIFKTNDIHPCCTEQPTAKFVCVYVGVCLLVEVFRSWPMMP